MMERVSGITVPMLEEFGTDPAHNLNWLDQYCSKHQVEYIVAHNGENFDKPLLLSELDRHGLAAPCLRSIPWIDTRTDLPFASEPDSRKLKHLALDAGFINPFAHRAVFDVLTMMRVFSNYDLKDILAYQAIPFVTIRAMVNFDNKELAKAQRFSWEKIGDKVYTKQWVKRIKQDRFEEEKQACAAFKLSDGYVL
jgi:DNA polymerase-3 subunit epsilon